MGGGGGWGGWGGGLGGGGGAVVLWSALLQSYLNGFKTSGEVWKVRQHDEIMHRSFGQFVLMDVRLLYRGSRHIGSTSGLAWHMLGSHSRNAANKTSRQSGHNGFHSCQRVLLGPVLKWSGRGAMRYLSPTAGAMHTDGWGVDSGRAWVPGEGRGEGGGGEVAPHTALLCQPS